MCLQLLLSCWLLSCYLKFHPPVLKIPLHFPHSIHHIVLDSVPNVLMQSQTPHTPVSFVYHSYLHLYTVSLRAALHTGSWSSFLAHPDLQQIDVSSDLIPGILFSLWAPKSAKPKSNQVYAYFKRRKWEKKYFTDLLTIARALWQATVNILWNRV